MKPTRLVTTHLRDTLIGWPSATFRRRHRAGISHTAQPRPATPRCQPPSPRSLDEQSFGVVGIDTARLI